MRKISHWLFPVLMVATIWLIYAAIRTQWVFLVHQAWPAYTAPNVDLLSRRFLVILCLFGLGLWGLWPRAHELRVALLSRRGLSLAWTGFCSAAILLILRQAGFMPAWFPLQPLIDHPGATETGVIQMVGHRLLFTLIGSAIHALVPSLDTVTVYLVSQVLPIVGTVWIVGELAFEVYRENAREIGQALLVAFLCPTFSYYTFYDIGIVGFYAAALLCLLRERYWYLAAVIVIATLNHENSLLIIPAAAWATFGSSRKTPILALSAATIGYVLVRAGLQWKFPAPLAQSGLWVNVREIATFRVMISSAMPSLAFRCVLLFLAWPLVTGLIRRFSTVLYAGLFLVTFVVGQFHESRQFDAAIPTEILFAISLLGGARGRESEVMMRDEPFVAAAESQT